VTRATACHEVFFEGQQPGICDVNSGYLTFVGNSANDVAAGRIQECTDMLPNRINCLEIGFEFDLTILTQSQQLQ
jgi:hypothetical protein